MAEPLCADVFLDAPPLVAQLGVGVHGTAVDREVFRLPGLWQLHLYRYRARVIIDGTVHEVRPNWVTLTPPGSVVEFHYRGRSEHVYAHFETEEVGEPRRVPVAQDLSEDAPHLADALSRAVAAHPRTPRRASAELWTVLWSIAESAAARSDGPHPAVATALAYIEANLAGPLTVPGIAREAGVSHNHLTRLFRAELDTTVVGHLRRRRLEVARHLLRNSTLSIHAVATQVGIPDLQAFNKACRREFGSPPRALRP
ncbi:helix-turn-helix transcriptional regulator [Kitasatospora cinereorecta]|uniref:Helix-turn-helix domain-containing protein n=1 Tax=Kitasatospora cinereorecta TaxID=285560 RepID=A0ABW0VAV6_9ACTN